VSREPHFEQETGAMLFNLAARRILVYVVLCPAVHILPDRHAGTVGFSTCLTNSKPPKTFPRVVPTKLGKKEDDGLQSQFRLS
jgi:hypothetical protein